MRTVLLPKLTQDELDMLNGFWGQMSDGVGENHRWCTKYWQNIEGISDYDADHAAITFDNTKLWKNDSDAEVIEDLCEIFIEITEEGMNDCSQSELYYHDDRRKDERLGQRVSNSIVEKFSGYPNHFEEYTDEEWEEECKYRQQKADELQEQIDKCNQGLIDLHNAISEMLKNS